MSACYAFAKRFINNRYKVEKENKTMIVLDNIGELYFEKETRVCGFLAGDTGLAELKKRQVVIFATGINSFLCMNLLQKHDITPYAFCENYKTLR